jgi:hypothetical protein
MDVSTRNLYGSKERSARETNNLTAICVTVVYKSLTPGRLTILWPSTADYTDSFIGFTALSFGSDVACYYWPITNELRGPQSARELYRLSDRHMSAKFSAEFCG